MHWVASQSAIAVRSAKPKYGTIYVICPPPCPVRFETSCTNVACGIHASANVRRYSLIYVLKEKKKHRYFGSSNNNGKNDGQCPFLPSFHLRPLYTGPLTLHFSSRYEKTTPWSALRLTVPSPLPRRCPRFDNGPVFGIIASSCPVCRESHWQTWLGYSQESIGLLSLPDSYFYQ